MRKTLILVALLALVGASSASAANRDPRVAPLQRQVQALTQRVNSLVEVVNRNADAINHNGDLGDCRFAYQIRFNRAVVNLFAAILNAPQDNSPLPSDNGACQRVGIAPPLLRTLSSSPLGVMAGAMAALVSTAHLSHWKH